ncbi:MAG: PQQ-dependent sugar dehydrogenase [Chitinophagales bacterium]|nr:PQQ-dependent sugar dehydrogenase [Chitinophagales bacterium]
MRILTFGFVLLFFPFALSAQAKLRLVDFASGFQRPVDITHCGDSRLFIVEQRGIIRIVDSNGVKQTAPFLDIDASVNSTGNEQGLLGLAFHPNYAQNGWFFVHYTQNSGGDTRVSRFSVSANDPGLADPNSELVILEADQPYSNHNGGSLKFGPDGYLYIGIGDGGSAGDPQANGQKKNTLLSKILRIDVNNSSATTPYVVPADNPFVADPAYRPEIWTTGLRNPWRISFDRLTGDLWIGDVGQNAREEIDFQPAGVGGLNYGWRCYEGTKTYNTNGCASASSYDGPAFEYNNPSVGCSVTGGFVYRGTQYPNFYGQYLFADYCSGRWWATVRNANGTFSTNQIATLGVYEYSSFGENSKGELFVALLSAGKIQRITDLCVNFKTNGEANTSGLCANDLSGAISLNISGGQTPYTATWSNGASGTALANLGPGNYIATIKDANGCEQRDTFNIANLSPVAPLFDSPDTLLCIGESVVFNLNADKTPLWAIFPSGWPADSIYITDLPYVGTATPNATQSLQAYFVDPANGCTSALSNVLNFSYDAAAFPIVSLNKDTLAVQDVWTAYQWYFNGQPIPGATGPQYIALQSGNYELYAYSAAGCAYQSGGIQVVLNGTEMPENVLLMELNPNPVQSSSLLRIQLRQAENIRLTLSDSVNKTIFAQSQRTQRLELPLDLHALPAGVYWLHVQLDSGAFTRRVVKH